MLPTAGLIDHVITGLELPVTVEVNVCVPPAGNDTVPGVTATVGVDVEAEFEPPPHPMKAKQIAGSRPMRRADRRIEISP
jgi:hypothetical protein